MSTDDPLNAYGVHFYQGIADDVADMQELAARALEFMSPEQRNALRAYLRDALDRFTPSELKGKVNRAIREYGFNSKSAVAFLQATFDQLEGGAEVRFPPHCDVQPLRTPPPFPEADRQLSGGGADGPEAPNSEHFADQRRYIGKLRSSVCQSE